LETKNDKKIYVFRVEGGRLGKITDSTKIRKNVFVTAASLISDKEGAFKFLMTAWIGNLIISGLEKEKFNIDLNKIRFHAIKTKPEYLRRPKNEEKGGHNPILDGFERIMEYGEIVKTFTPQQILQIGFTSSNIKTLYEWFLFEDADYYDYYEISWFEAYEGILCFLKKSGLELPPIFFYDKELHNELEYWRYGKI
jgi:hypothetical protein